MVDYQSSITETAHATDTLYAVVVSHPHELAPALARESGTVVIKNEQIESTIRRISWWKGVRGILAILASAVIFVLAYAMHKQYNVDLNWHYKWSIIEFDGSLQLTAPDTKK